MLYHWKAFDKNYRLIPSAYYFVKVKTKQNDKSRGSIQLELIRHTTIILYVFVCVGGAYDPLMTLDEA